MASATSRAGTARANGSAGPTGSTTGGNRSGTQAIERGLAVLRCFEREESLSVTEIGAQTGLTAATTHRIVRALRTEGWLEQDAHSERYHLGITTAVLGRLALERLGHSFALPDLQRLAASTGEAVSLGVRSGQEVLVVLQVPSSHPLRFHQDPGARNPVHVCSMGKLLVAYDGVETLDGDRFERFTSNTMTTRSELEVEFAEILDRGWSLNDEERTVGVRAIAAPVLDAAGRPIAAVTVQGPTVRFTDDRIRELVVELRETVRSIGLRRLG